MRRIHRRSNLLPECRHQIRIRSQAGTDLGQRKPANAGDLETGFRLGTPFHPIVTASRHNGTHHFLNGTYSTIVGPVLTSVISRGDKYERLVSYQVLSAAT